MGCGESLICYMYMLSLATYSEETGKGPKLSAVICPLPYFKVLGLRDAKKSSIQKFGISTIIISVNQLFQGIFSVVSIDR